MVDRFSTGVEGLTGDRFSPSEIAGLGRRFFLRAGSAVIGFCMSPLFLGVRTFRRRRQGGE